MVVAAGVVAATSGAGVAASVVTAAVVVSVSAAAVVVAITSVVPVGFLLKNPLILVGMAARL